MYCGYRATDLPAEEQTKRTLLAPEQFAVLLAWALLIDRAVYAVYVCCDRVLCMSGVRLAWAWTWLGAISLRILQPLPRLRPSLRRVCSLAPPRLCPCLLFAGSFAC